MSASGEGLGRVLTVALGLCLVCSMVVSTAAVLLKPAQQANKTLDLKRNILMAAGLLDPSRSVEEQFEQVETRVVNIDEGRFVDGVDPASFDQREAAKDPPSRARWRVMRIPPNWCVAKIRRWSIWCATMPVDWTKLFCRSAATACGQPCTVSWRWSLMATRWQASDFTSTARPRSRWGNR